MANITALSRILSEQNNAKNRLITTIRRFFLFIISKVKFRQGIRFRSQLQFRVFNMGVGFVVICDESEADKIMETLKEYCECQIIGKVTDDEKITVKAFEGSTIEY